MAQKIISGIFTDPDGAPVDGVTLSFTLITNTASSFVQRLSQCVTGADGAYTIALSNGVYSVASKDDKRATSLGTISIDDESEDGSLNSYLLAAGAPKTSQIIVAIQQTYQDMVNLQKTGVTAVDAYADIPADPGGWYLVSSDETKGNVPAVYLFADGKRFWVAMVEDAS